MGKTKTLKEKLSMKEKKKNLEPAKNRFEMVKALHKRSLEKAIEEKKADKLAIPMCKFVSRTKNFFTSSSCAGRIILLQLPEDESKKDACFHRKWHRKIKEKELWEGINAESKGNLWFKLDPFILHIGANTIENARTILKIMKETGIKRGGIIVAKPGKFLIELQGTQVMSFPVKKEKEAVIDKEYMNYALGIANKKLERNYALLKKLEAAVPY